ncbi:Six-hairpin glycosidase-like protein [Microdochium bolleyi]|uniref:Six-hairpin glycosidase-like protein n=1 Tax=Microdochium bolleyi TaxID=196109 RepID=A0A136IL00_9PEZI|nr:Six-hairpin glycosidase-like protein [Microdochium bolleyi]
MRVSPWYESARWIWVPDYDDTSPEGKICLFRRAFELAAGQHEPCILKVSADTRYELHVNDVRVSVGPCKSYPGRWYYETLNIQPFLRQGPNVISVRVLRFSDKHAGSLSLMRTSLPGLIVHCDVQGQQLHTNATWQAAQDTSVTMANRRDWNYALGPPFMVLDESVDGRKQYLNWRAPSSITETARWAQATVVSMRSMMMPILEPWKLVERPIPPMEEKEGCFDGVVCCSDPSMLASWTKLIQEDAAFTLPALTTAWVEFETKQYTTAYLSLQCAAGAGSRVEILCSECYEAPMPRAGPGVQRVKGDRRDHKRGKLYGPLNSYITHDGANVYEPFWFNAFRFIRLQVAVSDKPLQIQSFRLRTTYYPLAAKTDIATSAPGVEAMYGTSVETLRNCMHETYEDCPFYEQNQFLMDSRLQMLFTYQLSRDDRLARKTMHEFYASRRDDGLLQAQFPSPGTTVNIPVFSLFFVAMVHDHMLYFHDESLIKQYLGTIDGILAYFERLLIDQADGKGLVGHFEDPDDWAFVDWVAEWNVGPPLHGMATPPAYHTCPAATIYSLLYAWALQLAAELSRYVRRYDTATEYQSRATSLIEAVNEHCFDTEQSFYTDGPQHDSYSQHCQVFAILTGAIKGQQAMDLMLRTSNAVADHGKANAPASGTSGPPKIPKCSYAMSFYVFRAARMTGLYEELWAQHVAPWGEMLADSLVTFAESESMVRSDCHGWSAVPIYEVVAELFGVKPRLDGSLQSSTVVKLVELEREIRQRRVVPVKEMQGPPVMVQEQA